MGSSVLDVVSDTNQPDYKDLKQLKHITYFNTRTPYQ